MKPLIGQWVIVKKELQKFLDENNLSRTYKIIGFVPDYNHPYFVLLLDRGGLTLTADLAVDFKIDSSYIGKHWSFCPESLIESICLDQNTNYESLEDEDRGGLTYL